MKPQEKAEELINKMHYQICSDNGLSGSNTTKLCAKQCALIAVAETISISSNIKYFYTKVTVDNWIVELTEFKYWQEVKQEIQKL